MLFPSNSSIYLATKGDEGMAFYQPKSIEETKLLLVNQKGKILAGGTDLLIELRRESTKPTCIIDINQLSELKGIREEKNDVILGSLVTFTELLQNKRISENFPALIDCSQDMGSPQIRNMATIGGNIVNAGAAADFIPALMALNGILVFESVDEIRTISADQYFNEYPKYKIKEDELLTKVIIPKTNHPSGFYKLGKRNALAIARISVAIHLIIKEGRVADLNLCLGAVGRVPYRVYSFEKQAKHKELDWLLGEEAMMLLEEVVSERIKGRKSMPFKKEAIKGVYKEALRRTFDRRV